MSGSPFPFGSLPFEVLLNVIGLLDHRDINSICQLSRAFDEIATPVLYECVEWGRFLWEPVAGVYPTSPCLAFQRRPLLRNYVRAVILDAEEDANRMKYFQVACAQRICQELQLLPTVVRVHWGSSIRKVPSTTFYVFQAIVRAMEKLRTIRELYLPFIYHATPGYLLSIDQPLTVVSLRIERSSEPLLEWLEQHRHGLRELSIHMVNILNSVALFNASPFRNLRRFSQVPVTNLPYFLAAIREMQQLQHLSLGFDLDLIGAQAASPIEFVRLDKLSSLTIILIAASAYPPVDGKRRSSILVDCYQSLTTHSRHLETLHVHMNIPDGQLEIQGDKLLLSIANHHASSIRSLRLEVVTTTEEVLGRLLYQTTRLQELSLRIDRYGMRITAFATLGPLSATFQCLDLTFGSDCKHPDELEIERLFTQGMPQLRRLNVHAFSGVLFLKERPRYVSWERRWVFDEDLGSPCRQIFMTESSRNFWENRN